MDGNSNSTGADRNVSMEGTSFHWTETNSAGVLGRDRSDQQYNSGEPSTLCREGILTPDVPKIKSESLTLRRNELLCGPIATAQPSRFGRLPV
jgi:hypothetical protein